METSKIAPLLGRLWSPLAVVTSAWQGAANAQIGMAISNASIVPSRPRVLVQIYKANYSHRLIQNSRAFALNFLLREQWPLLRQFGFDSGRDRDKLAGFAYHTGITGCPILEESWGFLDCQVLNAMDGGDLSCFLAEVVDGDVRAAGEPLVARDARKLAPQDFNDEWDRRLSQNIEVSRKTMEQISYAPWNPSPS